MISTLDSLIGEIAAHTHFVLVGTSPSCVYACELRGDFKQAAASPLMICKSQLVNFAP
jgi:hypothetical protein